MDIMEQVQDDPEIMALLDFEPCPRRCKGESAWTPELQREFIVRLAMTGAIGRSAEEMGKTETGVRKVYRSPKGESFRKAWDAAVALAKQRKSARKSVAVAPGSRPPSLDGRRKARAEEDVNGNAPLPGQVMNEHGEWEDEASYLSRGEEAMANICNKLLRIRRLFLREISACAGKRAAFEILTELPIDWDIAALGEAQPDEPYRNTNQREPDMILMAESGWSFGDIGYGEDRKAEARAALDRHREEQGLAPVDWDADERGEAGESDEQPQASEPEQAEEEPPVRWTDINGKTHTSEPGTRREFGMNSQEFYDAVIAQHGRRPRD